MNIIKFPTEHGTWYVLAIAIHLMQGAAPTCQEEMMELAERCQAGMDLLVEYLAFIESGQQMSFSDRSGQVINAAFESLKALQQAAAAGPEDPGQHTMKGKQNAKD